MSRSSSLPKPLIIHRPMPDIIELGNETYIQTRVLMRGDLFGVFDRCGDLRPLDAGGHGLFYNESRHLSKSVLRLANGSLVLLSSAVTQDNARLIIELTNPDLDLPDGRRLSRRALHLQRTKFLCDNACEEEIRVRNYGPLPVAVELVLELEAD